ncbi:fumarylacetoacetate hydrolase family protein [Aminobacter sp. Piv2-1]|uniref:fumarylacetoacetate hydrolase family protein n=1 Tax=Aminobacter sp. Piv2-1 TaxID=3031122 RepID=UPI003099F40C
MKFARIGIRGHERQAILDSKGTYRDLTVILRSFDDGILDPRARDAVAAADLELLPAADASTRVGPCVANVGKIIGIGLNYADHAKESGMPVPAEPVIFGKPTSAISGPNDPIIIPPGSRHTDWEVELGVVIGKAGSHISENEAARHIAGFCVVNDVSERDFQLNRGGQWIKGKGYDSFAPIGPWLVTPDEIPDPHDLAMWLEVDGTPYQHSSTANMIFGCYEVISYLSRFMSLHPGDIITTGTPAGVGMGQTPPQYLRHGQTVHLGIERLGEQCQQTIDWHPNNSGSREVTSND